MGIREVSLIGGEPFLRRDWLSIAQAIGAAGMIATMVTGGDGITPPMAGRMRYAGIEVVSVSVDGLEQTHDLLRGRKGSWRRCFQTLSSLQGAGIVVAANTQLNRLSMPELPLLYRELRDAGIRAWRVQLTGPMGNAADNPEILLQPPELLDAFPVLALTNPAERVLRTAAPPWRRSTVCARWEPRILSVEDATDGHAVVLALTEPVHQAGVSIGVIGQCEVGDPKAEGAQLVVDGGDVGSPC